MLNFKIQFLTRFFNKVWKPLKSSHGLWCDLQPFPSECICIISFHFWKLWYYAPLFISKLSSELSHLTMCIFLEDLKKPSVWKGKKKSSLPFLWCLLYDLYLEQEVLGQECLLIKEWKKNLWISIFMMFFAAMSSYSKSTSCMVFENHRKKSHFTTICCESSNKETKQDWKGFQSKSASMKFFKTYMSLKSSFWKIFLIYLEYF